MKKKGFVAAAMAAVLASSMLSVPAFAWSKDDIIAGDEYTLIVSYHWSGIDQLVIGDTEDGTYFIAHGNTGCIAIVMEDENTVPDTTTISSDLTLCLPKAISLMDFMSVGMNRLQHCSHRY